MSDWDAGRVIAVPQLLSSGKDVVEDTLSREQAQKEAEKFIRDFMRENIQVYREALVQNYRSRRYYVEIDLADVRNDREALHDVLIKRPNEYIPMFEEAARQVLKSSLPELSEEEGGLLLEPADRDSRVPPIQVLFTGDLLETPIRQITAAEVNQLLLVPGIVINATRTRPKAVQVRIQCKNCKTQRTLLCPSGYGSVTLPRTCPGLQPNVADNGGNPPPAAEKCPVDPYLILPDQSKFVNQQTLKLQEAPESVPTGEMPRHIQLSVERTLADRIAPGTRVNIIGVASIQAGKPGSGALLPYLRVVGVTLQQSATGRALTSFTPEEEAKFRTMAAQPDIYQKLANSIAPSISGDYTEDIKKAILCLLLGGSRKLLYDGNRLRGDINVLLLGDPSTAKSQFLKFVERVAPVGVYTSGKGSSAAGLTASVVKHNNGEFALEGGAMVLADGGVVCIDEFDKMREEDRVAIHEAMEQQTISVAKAGITTILNSRCSVLAAANPVFGRYDDTKSAADNIDLLPTILSRFDMIFIVKDVRDEDRDKEIARHVIRVHVNGGAEGAGAGAGASGEEASVDIDIATMKRFIAYARSKCAPRLTVDAANELKINYAEIREKAAERDSVARGEGGDQTVIPITVRQLEALVRISEAVAKASLSREANTTHVREALRMFNVSTMSAAASGLGVAEALTGALLESVKVAENRIRQFIKVGDTLATLRVKEYVLRRGVSEMAFNHAVRVMERRDDLAMVTERKYMRLKK